MALIVTRIPERYRAGLAKIHSLPIEVVSAMADALGKASVSNLKEMTAAIERPALLSAKDAEAVVTVLHSLYVFKAGTESSIQEFVTVLVRAMQTSGSELLTVSDEERPSLESKLTTLLSLNRLERTFKIEQLRSDHQNIFYDAKILTDLRPVFDEPEKPPVGAIVSHTLKIVCHDYGEHREWYFALDAEDLQTLKKISERAMAKMESLKTVMKSANLPDLS